MGKENIVERELGFSRNWVSKVVQPSKTTPSLNRILNKI